MSSAAIKRIVGDVEPIDRVLRAHLEEKRKAA